MDIKTAFIGLNFVDKKQILSYNKQAPGIYKIISIKKTGDVTK